MKKISLLGATGSIGRQTMDVVRENKDQFEVVAFSAGNNIELTRKYIKEFSPALVSVKEKEDCEALRTEFPSTKFTYGNDGLVEVAVYPESSIVLNSVIGSVGLYPTLKAIEAKKDIALANKETLVTAGHVVMDAAKKHGVNILPVDSEHSAIFQALQGEQEKNIERLIITASGGSFRDYTRAELEGVTVEQALNHPNWSMGAKITIDSATMMNKGLEVIEAHWLFDMPYDKISVLMHKESIIHSMVEFHDGSIIAQLGTPDMRVPISYALMYPDRLQNASKDRLDLAKIATLHFREMSFERFPCLRYAYEAGKVGGTMPTVLNAANEVAVDLFLKGKISFLEIESLVYRALEKHEVISKPNLAAIQQTDQETRKQVLSFL
ncbi:1-deoxy-D-xylulose-5-phosphate reductoisomerase [Bacillus sp. AGMB 02131]|uniref:1-deoxy-D-xylulose 5-phosphate reductoisomerase n=1 Tax=Peribacillus faecalis TaxID=2772559 RepID=A0A927D1P6_9BACI|nr:1-deoxy-D-xylulose-5-phosphate reductoisomerase [Peribacillus faecalis]MBD3109409.1 1-deoxy-D-xylulose-5-phosphate reductoisomerase [Peribacillus faecalis]